MVKETQWEISFLSKSSIICFKKTNIYFLDDDDDGIIKVRNFACSTLSYFIMR
jgi:hypothetical protein